MEANMIEEAPILGPPLEKRDACWLTRLLTWVKLGEMEVLRVVEVSHGDEQLASMCAEVGAHP